MWEEGTWAAWLYDLLQQVQHIVVRNPRRNALLKEGSKSDKVDARKLADLLRTGMLRPARLSRMHDSLNLDHAGTGGCIVRRGKRLVQLVKAGRQG